MAAALFGTMGDGSNNMEQKIMIGHNRRRRLMMNWALRYAEGGCIKQAAAALL